MFMWKQRPGGSSPLARGTLVLTFTVEDCERLIPARAGNTHVGMVAGVLCAAHPRSRGEHLTIPLPLPALFGSSPLARGTHFPLVGAQVGVRLIPARAGNTCRWVMVWWPLAAHPRSRGEHLGVGASEGTVAGSSPLARGTRLCLAPVEELGRLIPARAGNTPHTQSRHRKTSAHPRSRGEHHPAIIHAPPGFGSSPLARGTQLIHLMLNL